MRPVRFARWVDLPGRLQGAVKDRPYGKPSPLGRRWRACAPDEGETSGRLPLIRHLR